MLRRKAWGHTDTPGRAGRRTSEILRLKRRVADRADRADRGATAKKTTRHPTALGVTCAVTRFFWRVQKSNKPPHCKGLW